MNCAAIIVGIDNWDKYTKPLIESIYEHEPTCAMTVVDNASNPPYPIDGVDDHLYLTSAIVRTERLCYSAAINYGKAAFRHDELWRPDWYIVLSNDVLCTGPFAHILASSDGNEVIGPLMKEVHGYPYIEGWCVCVPAKVWDAVGGWDENFAGSSYEDAGFCTSARERGFWLAEDKTLPFVHLDQRQRYHIVEDFAGKDTRNREYFLRKHMGVLA